jgi:Uma2 family endonuclease
MSELTYTPAPFTVRDYRALPDASRRYQVVSGNLYMGPSPNRIHQDISNNLEEILRSYLRKQPIGKMYHAPFDVFLTDLDVYQPDILFISKRRLRLLQKDGVHGAPDLVIEILSRSTARLDLLAKKRVYARCGVVEFWAVDPEERKVVIYDLQQSEAAPAHIWAEGQRFGCKLLPGLRLSVKKIFAT